MANKVIRLLLADARQPTGLLRNSCRGIHIPSCKVLIPKIAHRIFEASDGSNDLPPIIFMHAMLASQGHWASIAEVVAERTRRKVFTYDARNHGFSGFTRPYRFEDNLEDLLTFMDYIGTEQATLVGHNMGGMTAIQTSLLEPNRVEKLFVVDISVTRFPAIFIQRLIAFMKERGNELERLPKTVTKNDLQGTSYTNVHPEELSIFAPIMMERFRLLTDALQAYDQHPIEFRGQFLGPSYFLYGTDSPFEVGWDTKEIKNVCPQAEMIKFYGGTHNLFKEFPEKFVSTLVDRIVE